jgi:urea transporter/murein DD-endopeptidase MepM/ murein hydrolase activator NlpD
VKTGTELCLRPYARIVFSRDPWVGLLVLGAIASRPWVGAATLASVVLAQLTACVFGLGRETVEEGTVGTTAALTVLALGTFGPAGHPAWMVPLAAVLAVLFEAAFEAMLGSLALPTHALPFVLTSWVVMLAARSLPAPPSDADWAEVAPWLPAWANASGPLDIAASLLFSSGALSGALVLSAIALHSRIALLLGTVGGLVALGMRAWLRSTADWSWLDLTAGFNASLTAMAIGGVWFVPGPSSVLLSGLGAASATVLTYALVPVTGAAYLPVLSLPFVVTTHLVLMAARRRAANRRPTSTVPADRPEDSLGRHLMRLRRFGDSAWLPFRLPFRGQWVVTQGNDGAHTHQGPWRYGLDFEVRRTREDGAAQRTTELAQFPCYGLPVLAAGAGTVSSVVDGIEDNRPGEVNTNDVWGNVVVIAHGVGLYSAYAHLQPRSISVRPGETVPAGKEIARCGSSGRSPVPHLHFQLQRSSVMGSATLAVDFGDVVRDRGDSPELEPRARLMEGDHVRPITRDDAVARALGWSPGSEFELSDPVSGASEEVRSEVDLLGRRSLVSQRGRLWFESYEGGLVLLDFQGYRASLLRLLLLALPRVPFERAPSLHWRERLPRRVFLPVWLRSITDILAVVGGDLGAVEVHCSASRRPGTLALEYAADRWVSRAELSLQGRAHAFELRTEDTVRRLTLQSAGQARVASRPAFLAHGQETWA